MAPGDDSGMTSDLLVRYFHFLALIIIAAAIFANHSRLKASISRFELRKLRVLDCLYWIALVAMLVTGLMQWLSGSKPAEFYTSNPLLHTKVLLYFVLVILSIVPSLFFLKNRKGQGSDAIAVGKGLVWIVRIQLLLLVVIPLLATLIAKGIGIPVSG